jgi:translation initiation factor 5B
MKDAQDEAENLGVRIFTADIIYHLFDQFTKYLDDIKAKKREAMANLLVYPAIGNHL